MPAFRTVQRMAKLAGIEGQISPHILRHTLATIALDAGSTLHDLQDSMGHADPCTNAGMTVHGTSLQRPQDTSWHGPRSDGHRSHSGHHTVGRCGSGGDV